VIILGIILIAIGWFIGLSWLLVLGVVLAVVGLVLLLVPGVTGGRRLY